MDKERAENIIIGKFRDLFEEALNNIVTLKDLKNFLDRLDKETIVVTIRDEIQKEKEDRGRRRDSEAAKVAELEELISTGFDDIWGEKNEDNKN